MKLECAKEWSRKFLRENFTNVFLTSKFKEHMEDLLFDQEKALMPATQPLVEEKIRKMNITKQMNEIDKLINDLYKQKRELEHNLRYGVNVSASEKEERAKFVRQCPATGCRGFLSTQWKCGICEQWTCPDCHELKGMERDCEHTCDPNNVETAKMLAKDSKPCPKCQSMIFKIEGCDQMWCTQCHTAFSWKTGRLEKNIHNPHYYEWQRKNGGLARAAGDIECGRDLTHYTVDRINAVAKKHPDLYKVERRERETYSYGIKRKENISVDIYSELIKMLHRLIRNIIHVVRVELLNFQTDYVVRNQDLRIRYLEGGISENEFKNQIQRNDKKNKKNTEVAQVIQLANTAVTDIIYRIIDDLDKSIAGKHNLNKLVKEFGEIIQYCNNIFKDISFTYSTVHYGFNGEFEFMRVEKEKKQYKKKLDNQENKDDYDDL